MGIYQEGVEEAAEALNEHTERLEDVWKKGASQENSSQLSVLFLESESCYEESKEAIKELRAEIGSNLNYRSFENAELSYLELKKQIRDSGLDLDYLKDRGRELKEQRVVFRDNRYGVVD